MSPSHSRLCALAAACLAATCLVLTLSSPSSARVVQAASSPPQQLTLERPDTICRNCHQAIYDTYAQTPMAQGSGIAVHGLDAAQLHARDLHHAPSGIAYHVSIRGGQAYLAYDRVPSSSRPILHGEDRLAYFIGSGKRGRTYLYARQGLWFEAPINWYGKKQLWDMAPAYENVAAMPPPLPVDSNCLHCHAGDVQTSLPDARNHFDGPPFRAPGIGCAACHGDPSAHLAAAANGKPGPILNPARLDPTRRDSVCLQCHLEGDATVYKPGKSLAAFRPGDNLSGSAIYFVDANRAQGGGRATSQYEALLRSACKRASGDRLTCTTCHDPHSSPDPAHRVAFFRAKCLACHTVPAIVTQHHPEQQDCAVCHMPTRKTLDISHEQLTGHDIEARPLTLKTLAPTHRSPELVPIGTTHASAREEGLAYAQLAIAGDRTAGERALKLLQQAENSGSNDVDLHDRLGFLLQISGSSSAAAMQYGAALRQNPHDTTAAANLAVLAASAGNPTEAIRLLKQVVADDPAQTAAALNLAFLQCRLGRKAEARALAEKTLTFQPDSPTAQTFLETGAYGNQTCSLR